MTWHKEYKRGAHRGMLNRDPATKADSGSTRKDRVADETARPAKVPASSCVCDYCGKYAVFCASSAHVYRKDWGPIWHCAKCDAWVGCHPSGAPLGRLANKPLRLAKIAAHAAFDPLVEIKMRKLGGPEHKQHARGSAYKWLAEPMGLSRAETHIGMFDETQCMRVIEICNAARRPATRVHAEPEIAASAPIASGDVHTTRSETEPRWCPDKGMWIGDVILPGSPLAVDVPWGPLPA